MANKQTNSVILVRERTIPTERPPLVGEVTNNFCGFGCCVVRTTNPYGHILRFIDRSRYFLFQVAPQLYSRGWVDSVPDPLFLGKPDSVGKRTRDLWICSHELWPLDHRGSRNTCIIDLNVSIQRCFRYLIKNLLRRAQYRRFSEPDRVLQMLQVWG
jgi:hypothetical protein